jgi:8-oxo-dGTP diphosphatase
MVGYCTGRVNNTRTPVAGGLANICRELYPRAMSPDAPHRKTLHVACALIERGGLLLTVQRSAAMSLPLKWEFPGGKIEPGEDAAACLRREVREELGVEVEIGDPLPAAAHDYPSFSVVLYPLRCRIASGEPTLNEHAAARWLSPADLLSVDWAAADLPVLEAWRTLRSLETE